MKYSKDFFGSRLDIIVEDTDISPDIIEKCFEITHSFEETYSRFIRGNFLHDLNTNKSSEGTPELLSILRLCDKVSQMTEGYFDITLLPLLENKGYGIETASLDVSIGYKNICIEGEKVILKNNVSIDLGSVGKGYIIDKIYNYLSQNLNNFTINFGGDMRIKGKQEVLLEDPCNETQSIGSIQIHDGSIASSSGNKRKITDGHHLLNPKTGASENEKLALYVTHKLASFADIFSTALFVTPIDKTLKILEQTKGLEALIIMQDGTMYKSRGFNCNLNTEELG